MKFISRSADAAAVGDLMVMPKRASLRFTSVATLRKFGMSIGDTCRSQNRTATVRDAMLAGRTTTLFLVVDALRAQVPDDASSLTLTSEDLGETPRGRLQSVRLLPLERGFDVKWASMYNTVLEDEVWRRLMDGREASPFNLASSWRSQNPPKTRAWKPETLDFLWDRYRMRDCPLKGNPLDASTPSWTGAYPEWARPDLPTGPFTTDGLVYSDRFLRLPETAVKALGARGVYVAKPDAEMADYLVRRAASVFAKVVLGRCGTSLRLADALMAALKRDKTNMADAMKRMAAHARRLDAGSSAAAREIKRL